MAWQQGDPGKGSGEPYVMKVEQAEKSSVTVAHSGEQDTNEAHSEKYINTPIIILIFCVPILRKNTPPKKQMLFNSRLGFYYY